MEMLRYVVRDWASAPISGTVILIAVIMACVNFYSGDTHGGLLWTILAHVVEQGR